MLVRTNREGLRHPDRPEDNQIPDTLYRDISGMEQQILDLGLRRAVK